MYVVNLERNVVNVVECVLCRPQMTGFYKNLISTPFSKVKVIVMTAASFRHR